jgi:hypothetical protein
MEDQKNLEMHLFRGAITLCSSDFLLSLVSLDQSLARLMMMKIHTTMHTTHHFHDYPTCTGRPDTGHRPFPFFCYGLLAPRE